MDHLELLGLKVALLNYTAPTKPEYVNSQTKMDLES